MDQHALLMYTMERQTSLGPPGAGRRRQELLRIDAELHAARRRRRRELARRAWSGVVAATRLAGVERAAGAGGGAR